MTDQEPSAITFGQSIRELRRDAKMTQRVAAEKLGIDFTYLSKIENDRGDPPSEQTIRAMAGIYHGDEEELLALAGKLPPSLRERAIADRQFATFLRRLPGLSDDKLRELYDSTEPDDSS